MHHHVVVSVCMHLHSGACAHLCQLRRRSTHCLIEPSPSLGRRSHNILHLKQSISHSCDHEQRAICCMQPKCCRSLSGGSQPNPVISCKPGRWPRDAAAWYKAQFICPGCLLRPVILECTPTVHPSALLAVATCRCSHSADTYRSGGIRR